MARTPIGVLSFESSLPPFAHFLSAENIAERWLSTYYLLVSRLRDLTHVVRWMLNISKWSSKRHCSDIRGKDGGSLGYSAKTRCSCIECWESPVTLCWLPILCTSQNWSFNILPPRNPPPRAFELLTIHFLKFPPLGAKKPFKCPTN